MISIYLWFTQSEISHLLMHEYIQWYPHANILEYYNVLENNHESSHWNGKYISQAIAIFYQTWTIRFELSVYPCNRIIIALSYMAQPKARLLRAQRCKEPGPRRNIKTVFPGMEIPMLKIRRSRDRLIFNMGIPILVRQHLYIEAAPGTRASMVSLLFSDLSTRRVNTA